MERLAAVAHIVNVLAPYLGPTMAEASARVQCEKLGITGEAISAAQVEALIAKLASGLAVFVGRDTATTVVGEIRGRLAAHGKTA